MSFAAAACAVMLALTCGAHAQERAGAAPASLPECINFESNTLPQAWKVVASDGTTVTAYDKWLAVEGPANSRGHLQRGAPAGNITYSANIRYLGSIYVAWDKDNWCAAGKVSPTPFGRLYSAICNEGKAVKEDHRGIDAGAPQHLRIQIGSACVRFEYSFDQKKWHLLRVVDRPKGLTGNPTVLLAGKYYDSLASALSSADAAPTEPGPRMNGYFTDICISATPATADTITPDEQKFMAQRLESDPLGAEVLAMPGDPTFDAVAKYFPPMQRPREIVGVPEHPIDIGINHRAQIDKSPWEPCLGWVEVGTPSIPFGDLGPLKRELAQGHIPVVTLSTEKEGVKYTQTILGWTEGYATDKDLYGYVQVTASGASADKLPAEIALVQQGTNDKKTWKTAAAGDGRVAACFRFKHPDLKTAEPVTAEEFEKKQKDTIEFWRGVISKAERFDVPDKRVADGYRAWYAYSLLNCDMVNGKIEAHDGSGFYEMIYGYSMALHSINFDLYGLKSDVERRLDTQLSFQGPDGLYVQECGLPDHGCLTVAIARHYLVTRDADWLKRVAPQFVKLCEWIMTQRAGAPKEGMTRGLIKFRPYNDYPQPVYNYLGNSYACLGLEAAGRVLAEIGMKDEAKRYAEEGKRFRQDILDSMKASTFDHEGMRILPIEPDTQRLLKLSDYRGGDYYGLVSGSLMENDFLDANSEHAIHLTDALEKRKGLILGMCEFMEGIDHAYTYGYWLTQLKRDNIEKVLLGFWSMQAYGMTQDTYSPVEVTYHVLGENHYTLPHLYSCTHQLRLLRNMLVREDGESLLLGQAIPHAWLQTGKHVGISEAPTVFGNVSCRISANSDRTFTVDLTPPTRNPPREIRIRLRDESGRGIAKVEGAGNASVKTEADYLILTNVKDKLSLTVSR